MLEVTPAKPCALAAVDLGSNSFHLLLARRVGASIQGEERIRETVRLASGLDADGCLDAGTRSRALACLRQFGARLAHLPDDCVRAVGTDSLRRLRDDRFRAAASAALGHEVEIISGQQEAQLIYAAVCSERPADTTPCRVIDIGGGSTELALGAGGQVRAAESLGMGCISFTRSFFADGEIDAHRLDCARRAARERLSATLGQDNWRGKGVPAIGTSGTILGAWRVLQAEERAGDAISRPALDWLLDRAAGAGSIAAIGSAFPSLRPDRRAVFAAGIAILAGVFDALELEEMHTSPQALREGLALELAEQLNAAGAAVDEAVGDASRDTMGNHLAAHAHNKPT